MNRERGLSYAAPVDPVPERLRLFGGESDAATLPWSWASEQLETAGTYWVVARADGHPHPRPVWGIWRDDTLQLSIGSPVLGRQVAEDPRVTVHLESGTAVVIIEGAASLPSDGTGNDALAAYNAKYDWNYTVEEYGPLTIVRPATAMAWRSAGWAGRGGFQQTGRWHFA